MQHCVTARRRFGFATGVLLAAVCFSSICSLSEAQLPQTRVYSVFPMGAQVGQTVDVTVANGADLDELDQLLFSHPGITATHKSGNTFAVTVAANVPAGVYEARAHGLYGTSNPRSFVVGTLPEIAENDANNTTDQAQTLEIGTVINGRSNRAADVDFFRVSGKKGQRLLIECQALRIDSKFQGELRIYSEAGKRIGRTIARMRTHDPLLDVTLPADGDYLIRVTDFVYGGSNDHGYRLKVHTGPYVDFVMPPAGVPGSKGRYTLYGRNLPGSQPAEIAADGRKLEKLDVEITLPNEPATLKPGTAAFSFEAAIDGSSYLFKGANGSASPVTIAFAPASLTPETEPNNEPGTVQKIAVPAEIAGQFYPRADVDRFEFEAKAGNVFWIEVFGQRLGRLTDPYLAVEQVTKKDDGTETLKRLTSQDDDTRNSIANLFDTVSNDAYYRLAVPADGLYRVSLRDRYGESRGTPDLQYHLAIREESPDFRLAVIPPAPLQNAANGYQTWALGLRRGENLHVEVAAIRRHGFKGVIDITADGLPAGLSCRSVSIDGNATSATLVFSAADDAKGINQPIRIVGTATVESDAAVKAVTAAEAALTKAKAALPALDQALQKTVDPLTKAEAAKATAATTAKTDADALKVAGDAKAAAEKAVADAGEDAEKKKVADEALKKAQQAFAAADQKAKQSAAALAKATAAFDTANAAFQKADAAKKAGETAIANAEADLTAKQKAQKAASRVVSHPARTATVVWNGTNQSPAVTRVSQQLTLTIMDEAAPYQVAADVEHERLSHNRQLLIPVKLTKRNGFDNKVQLTFQKVPKNLQVQNLAIDKGKDSAVLRLFVPTTVAEGTYTLFLQAQGQVSYQKNPKRLERATAAKTAAEAALKEATAAAAKAKTDADRAAKALADATTAVKPAQDKLAAATKTLADAEAAAKKATEESKEPDTAAVDNAKTAVDTAKKAADEAQAAVTAATEAKKNADTAKTQADAKVKEATTAKTNADKEHKAASDYAKAKNINVFAPSTPVTISVRKGLFTLAIKGGGNLKRGEQTDVTVTLKRDKTFTGPVKVALAVPPGTEGLSAQPITIAADQTEGVISIKASAEATEGDIANLVVRGSADSNGPVSADQTVKLKVVK